METRKNTSSAGAMEPKIPPITKGDKAVKLNTKPVSAPITDAIPQNIKNGLVFSLI